MSKFEEYFYNLEPHIIMRLIIIGTPLFWSAVIWLFVLFLK